MASSVLFCNLKLLASESFLNFRAGREPDFSLRLFVSRRKYNVCLWKMIHHLKIL